MDNNENPRVSNLCASMQDLEGSEAAAQDGSGLASKAGSSARRTAVLSPSTSQTVPGWMLDKL